MSAQTLAQLRSGHLAGARRLDLSCGLTELPREVFDLADSLEILNLTGNQLGDLPDDLPRLKRLRILFCSHNAFTHLPAVLGACPSLSMVGFRANQIETVDAASFAPSLRWLILTENRIRELPASLGACAQMQKLMLAGNRITDLPEELAACANLEMLRIASNDLPSLPPWLLQMPRLSWIAFAGNPCSPSNHSAAELMPHIPWKDLEVHEKLGEGASGTIHRALWRKDEATTQTRSVAVKLFKSAMASDGLPACEMDACLAAGSHEHLIPMHGSVAHHPEGRQGLVMSIIDPAHQPLAGPPSFDTCTRDVYPEDLRLSPHAALSIVRAIASAAAHLHSRGILHGDLYAHNVLWHADGHCCLGDFGAATFYSRSDSQLSSALERIEVRAFGCLLEELLTHTAWTQEHQLIKDTLTQLQAHCFLPNPTDRPSFADLIRDLLRVGSALQEDSAPPV